MRYQREFADLQGTLSGTTLQLINGIAKLRVAGAQRRAFVHWARHFADQRSVSMKAQTLGVLLTTFNEFYVVVMMMVVFGMAVASTRMGLATGEFLAFNAAFSQFMAGALAVSASMTTMVAVVPLYERAQPILNTWPETDRTKAHPGEVSGRIEVSHVSFRYDKDGPLVLDDVSLEFSPGEFVALVGPSGSGKSTLLRLLLGFEAPDAGAILYDKQDLAELDIQAIRRQIGVVLQNGKLFSGDMFTNIIGAAPLTMDDAWEAAEKAGLADDIRAMPMGMHTIVSEGARTLSGGQRQRLLIARSIVKNPRIIIFDEATSALDNRTQAIVSQSLEQLEATRIVIAHRLSTIVTADRIYVLENGRIVQHGSYEQLVRQRGLFSDMARRQILQGA
jgi:ATP-binding cassette subfamily C protein